MVSLRQRLLFAVLLAAFSASLALKRKDRSDISRHIEIQNDSDATVLMFWIHPETNEHVDVSEKEGLVPGADTSMDSFVGHTFEVQEKPKKNGKCKSGPCRIGHFTVNANEGQLFTINSDFTITVEDHKSKSQKKAKEAIQGCQVDETLPSLDQIEALSECLMGKINATIDEQQQEILFQANVRKEMGEKLVLYACQDDKMNTTAAIANKTWTSVDEAGKEEEHLLKVLFESQHSSILLAEDALTEEQCQALIKVSEPTPYSGERNIPQSANDDMIARSALQRIANMAGQILGATFVYDGRDPLLYIQTHVATHRSEQCELNVADGTCLARFLSEDDIVARTVHAQADDTAAMQIFCTAPALGGGIHFAKAGVHVNTRESVGQALFILYTDMEQGSREDDPFTEEHVSCPVREGEMVAVFDFYAVSYDGTNQQVYDADLEDDDEDDDTD